MSTEMSKKCAKKDVDCTLYLVTDSTMVPEGKTFLGQVTAALEEGCTMVQLREKYASTQSFVQKALELKELCHTYGAKLIINDRVDVALAVQADGVHVGQDDMPVMMVRRLIGPEAIVGWSVGKPEEVDRLAEWGPAGVDYIGIGTVFETQTKKDIKKVPMGPEGVSRILSRLEERQCHWCRTVAIGGLHPNNVEGVLNQSYSEDRRRSLDGISVVSDIMASEDARKSTRVLLDMVEKHKKNIRFSTTRTGDNEAIHLIDCVRKKHPLIHHITNKVHQNFGANVALAIGCSPIMSELTEEFAELSKIPNSVLLLNTGSQAGSQSFLHSIESYNSAGRPIVFDPVGFGASETRKSLNLKLLSIGKFSCIKGNAGEILGISGEEGGMRGVDSVGNHSSETLIEAAQSVAFKYRTVVVCTGKADIVVDGTVSSSSSSNNSEARARDLPFAIIDIGDVPLFSYITASGCSLGTVIAGFLGACTGNKSSYEIVKEAVLFYKQAGKKASVDAKGSGSFMVGLIDNLYNSMNDFS